jgi:hypothetical protein
VSSDLKNPAYREAVDSLERSINVVNPISSSATQLFAEFDDIDKDATQQSAFVRGVAYLRSIQVPLEKFKVALCLALPIISLDLAATAAFDVFRSVTAVSNLRRIWLLSRHGMDQVLMKLNIDCDKLHNGRPRIFKSNWTYARADFLH